MMQHQKSWPDLIVPSLTLITPCPGIFDLLTPLPVISFPKKLAPNVPNKILKNPPFDSFGSFLIVYQ